MQRRGFTMIEVMIVVVVAAVVVGVAIPSFNATYKRSPLDKGKGMVQDAILDAKVHAATGTSDWQVIFNGAANRISSGPIGGAISDVRTLSAGCEFSVSSLNLTYEFYRDGTAISDGGLIETNKFSIENDRGEAVSFTLVGQIGEVRVGSGEVTYPGGGDIIQKGGVTPGGGIGGVTPGGEVGGVGIGG